MKLGLLNLMSMIKIKLAKAIKGIMNPKVEEVIVCGDFQIGKQAKMPHKRLKHLTTSKVVELLHMDITGPVQFESLGGRRYIFVCVDDYIRFTWTDFLREKSDTFVTFERLC